MNVSESQVKTNPILSQHEKYRKVFHLTQKLATVVSEATMREYDEKVSILEQLLKFWQGDDVVQHKCNEEDITGIY